jgi:hypothetical protein
MGSTRSVLHDTAAALHKDLQHYANAAKQMAQTRVAAHAPPDTVLDLPDGQGVVLGCLHTPLRLC